MYIYIYIYVERERERELERGRHEMATILSTPKFMIVRLLAHFLPKKKPKHKCDNVRNEMQHST